VAVRRRPAREAPGQHFLRSRRLAADLVAEAGVARGDLVVDIGAGTGALTGALARAGAEVIALEVDGTLAAQLRRRFASTPSVAVVEGDVLAWSRPDRPFAVVANLPFARSGAILDRLLGDPGSGLRRADVIVQWELAVKQAAVWPATMRATYWGAWWELSVARRLARSAFAPPPAVFAAVLRIVRRERPLVAVHRSAAYRRLLDHAFSSRQPLTRCLAPYTSRRELKRLAAVHGFDPGGLPRDLDRRQWAAVFLALDAGSTPRSPKSTP
jgi:23S rRNA (adenine-N6)-dimethyltransferase